jgi:tRNA(Arg) A34 adenosine deaminase TadA
MTRSDSGSDAERFSGAVELGYLSQAVGLAVENAAAGELPFGALVVRNEIVLATGVNTALRDRDPTAHAEVTAVRSACRNLGELHLSGASIFSSCEPCAVCHAVAASVGIDRIFYAAPKDLVPDLHYPAPHDTDDLADRMQEALRSAVPGQVVHVSTIAADEPFRRYLTNWGSE